MMEEKTTNFVPQACLVSSCCAVRFSLRGTGGGVLLAQLCSELVQTSFVCTVPKCCWDMAQKPKFNEEINYAT